MIVKKPSIFIYTHLADEAILREVCAGVEEEGVFYEITEFPDECMEKLSYKAARDSMLGSGIGIFGTAVCLKMRGLEKGRNIEAYISFLFIRLPPYPHWLSQPLAYIYTHI